MSDQGINILVLGKTGVGKSSFCNYIFNDDVFITGKGKPVTGWKDHFKFYSVEHDSFTLNVYDSVGIETDNFDKWENTLDSFLSEHGHSSQNNPINWLHGAFYLINAASARIEEIEKNIIKKISEESNIPLTVVLTNADAASENELAGVKKEIREYAKEIKIDINVFEVCSVNIRTRSGERKKYGKDEVLNSFLMKLDRGLRESLLKYYIDMYIDCFIEFKNAVKNKINESDLGFMNILMGVIKDGDSFDIDNVFDFDSEFLEKIIEDREETMDQLNGFLDSLSFSYDNSTRERLDKLDEDIEEQFSQIEGEMDSFVENIEHAFSHGGIMQKMKAATEILKLVVNIKGFFNNMIDKSIDPIINSLINEKYSI